MDRKKGNRREGSRDRERTKKNLKNRRKKGKMKEREIDTSSESEGYTTSESSTDSESSCHLVRPRKKKFRRSRSREYVKVDDRSDREGRSRKRKRKRVRGAEENKMTVKGTMKILDAETTSYSEFEPEAEPLNCFGDVTIDSKDTYYRCNFKTAIKEIKSIPYSDEHLFEMKKTPFWLLFNAIQSCDADLLSARCVKFEDDIRDIMMTFYVKYNYFAIAQKMMRVTSGDVNLILGLYGGDEAIPVRGSDKDYPPWICSRFTTEIASVAGKYVLYKTSVFAKLEKTVLEVDEASRRDVTRLTICYLLASLLTPLRSAAISSHVTWCLENLEDAHIYDWCGYVVDILHSQIRGSKNLNTGGCAILLPFWLCEHTNLVAPVDDTAFPRFLRWDLSDLNERLSNVNLKKLKPKNLRRVTLNPTSGEKLVLKDLVSFWKADSEKELKGKSVQGDHTLNISGSDTNSGVGYQTCNEFERTRQFNNGSGVSGTLALLTAAPSSSRPKKDSLDIFNFKKAANETMTTPLSSSFGPSYSIGMTQEFQSIEAQEQIRSVLKNINSVEDETGPKNEVERVENLAEKNRELKAQVEFLEGVVESKTLEINDLKRELEEIKIGFAHKENEWRLAIQKLNVDAVAAREAEYSQQIMRLKEEMARLLAKNEDIMNGCAGPFELTETQFFEDPENMERIKELEEQHMAATNSVKHVEDISVVDADEGDGGSNKMRTGDVHLVDNSELDEGQLAPVDVVLEARTPVDVILDRKGGARDNTDRDLDGGFNGEDPVRVHMVVGDTVKVSLQVVESSGTGVEAEEGTMEIEKTPEGKDNECRKLPTPGTIVRAVKARTDRKAVELTPQPTTSELLEGKVGKRQDLKLAKEGADAGNSNDGLAGSSNDNGSRILLKGEWAFQRDMINVDEIDFEDAPSPDDPPKMKLDYKKTAAKKCSVGAIGVLEECWSLNRSRCVVWKGRWAFSEVTMNDALSILHHKSLSTWTVDAWSEMMKKKYAEKDIGYRMVIFSSACWGLINSREEGGENKSLKKFVDDPLLEIKPYGQLLFPMLTSGASGVGKDAGNHWTLLRLDLRSCEWRFYNSNRPRSDKIVDVHMKRTSVLVDYVENNLRQMMSRKMRSHKLLKSAKKEVVQSACPQQAPESEDCGVVCCQNIENLLAEKGCTNRSFSDRNSGDYRARMVEFFTNPLDSVV